MRALVVGSGGREHALAWGLARSASVERVFAAPGNPGMESVAELADLDPLDAEAIAGFCEAMEVPFVVIGPERPLIRGVADDLRSRGLAVYGPGRRGAALEGSKAFSKRVMAEEGVPTAEYAAFTDAAEAKDYVEAEYASGRDLVVKASGEALGKGAVVAKSREHALDTVQAMLVRGEFGEAGREIVVERRLEGREVSLLAVCGGERYALLPPAQDYKAAFDGGEGPNTGGMGAYSPVAGMSTEEWARLGETFIAPILRRLAADGQPFLGTLYAGLMLTEEGPKCLEYNVRFGDPEAQCILPRVESDFASLLFAAARAEPLPELSVGARACVVVVVAAKGYPGEYPKGLPIPQVPLGPDALLFHAGTARGPEGLVSAGGRVLNVAALADDRLSAAGAAYRCIEGRFGGEWHYRTDIGR